MSFRDRRDQTPAVPGRPIENEVFILDAKYDDVFVNDEDFIANERKDQQFMILDIGCRRSLMGLKEYERFKRALS